MIARKENGILKIKTIFNLQGEQYKLDKDNFILSEHSLIIEVEMMEILGKELISLEIIATGFKNINAYKKFITSKNDLCVGDGKIMYEDLKDVYMNNTLNKQLVSSIIADTMLSYNPNFFNE